MWSSRRVGLFPWRYRIEDGGSVVGRIDLGHWATGGRIELDGRELTIRRQWQGFSGAKYFLTDAGQPLGVAQATGANGFYLARGDEEYRLDRAPLFSRSFELSQRGQPLGRIRAGFFLRDASIQLDGELAPEFRLFAFWLVAQTWRRAAQAVVVIALIAALSTR